MRATIVGAGPAGVFAAIMLKRSGLASDITLVERKHAAAEGGWGIVMSDRTLAQLEQADSESIASIRKHLCRIDGQVVHIHGSRIPIGGYGYSLSRNALLRILLERAERLGVTIRTGCVIDASNDLFSGYSRATDLVIVAEGVNSAVRARHAMHFGTEVTIRPTKYLWLGTRRLFDPFAFLFHVDASGVCQAHAHKIDAKYSTFVVECSADYWRSQRFDALTPSGTLLLCERLFEPWLEGNRLLANQDSEDGVCWRQFKLVSNKRWHLGNVVLVGDAARTAHFSVGSGASLALQDSVALVEELKTGSERGLEDSLLRYWNRRRAETKELEGKAFRSMEWFENVTQVAGLSASQFAQSFARRVASHE